MSIKIASILACSIAAASFGVYAENVNTNINTSYIANMTPEQTLENIQLSYRTQTPSCNGTPAYDCSGVVIHGESHDHEGMPWETTTVNMAYSYIRSDVPAPLFYNYAYGIILFPNNDIADGLYRPAYRCGFPQNGLTDIRSDGGCGEFNNALSKSRSAPCQDQGIFTAEEYISKMHPCGFDLEDNDTAASAFQAVYEGSAKLSGTLNGGANNEILINHWDNEDLEKLPIQALFYAVREGSANNRNLVNAQEAQREYSKLTHKWIPIIHMDEIPVPDSENKLQVTYSFNYYKHEQGVPYPVN